MFWHKKKWNTDTYYKMDDTWNHYAKCKKPKTKDHMMYYSYLYKTYRISKSINMEIDWWLLTAKAVEGEGN